MEIKLDALTDELELSADVEVSEETAKLLSSVNDPSITIIVNLPEPVTPTLTLASGISSVSIDAEIGGYPGEGTTNYEVLSNKPQINGVELIGNKAASAFSISYNTLVDLPSALTTAQIDEAWYIDVEET